MRTFLAWTVRRLANGHSQNMTNTQISIFSMHCFRQEMLTQNGGSANGKYIYAAARNV